MHSFDIPHNIACNILRISNVKSNVNRMFYFIFKRTSCFHTVNVANNVAWNIYAMLNECNIFVNCCIKCCVKCCVRLTSALRMKKFLKYSFEIWKNFCRMKKNASLATCSTVKPQIGIVHRSIKAITPLPPAQNISPSPQIRPTSKAIWNLYNHNGLLWHLSLRILNVITV